FREMRSFRSDLSDGLVLDHLLPCRYQRVINQPRGSKVGGNSYQRAFSCMLDGIKSVGIDDLKIIQLHCWFFRNRLSARPDQLLRALVSLSAWLLYTLQRAA